MADFRKPRPPRPPAPRTPGPAMAIIDPVIQVRSVVDEALRERFGGMADLWPHWDERRILFEDRDVIVVDKPVNVPTHAPEHGVESDAVSRLGRRLGALGEDGYLGIHQRLDRDTSGVLLFARRKEANAGLARQFEGREVEKVYLAIVPASVRVPAGGLLVHAIREGEGGRMVAEDPRRARPGAKEARTRVQVLERRGGRALIEARPETGRTHQIRVQLAAIGAPIDGDVMYGGAPATRLMLHARRLKLTHPLTGKPLEVEAPEPRALRDHLAGALDRLPPDVAGIVQRLREAAAARHPVAASGETDAFRLCNGAGDALPGMTVDVYREHLVVSLAGELDEAAREHALDAAAALGARGVYVKLRPKHASVVVDTRREEVAPPLPVRGEPAPDPLIVRENELAYEVRLGDGLSTGLFLDTRAHRARVRDMAKDTRFLNLFAYTGSFTVAAVAGGATASTTVDVSRTVLAWGERNLTVNRLAGPEHTFAEADVLPWLDAQVRLGARWDLAVLDPPSFATTKSSRFSVESDYRELVARVMRVMAPGGSILCCTNHRGVVMAKLRRWIHEAARAAGVGVTKLRDLPYPSDFPPVPGMEPHLKVALVTLGPPGDGGAPGGDPRRGGGDRRGPRAGGPPGRMRRS